MPALAMKVNGYKHKGRFIVAYNEGRDLFEIFALRGEKIKHHIDGIFFDELQNVCDYVIETGDMTAEQYKEKVKKTYEL